MVRKAQYDYYDDKFKATAVELGALLGVYAKDVAPKSSIFIPSCYTVGRKNIEMEIS